MNNFKNTFHKITILSLIVLSCLNLYNSIFSNISLIFLTENQILYIFSFSPNYRCTSRSNNRWI